MKNRILHTALLLAFVLTTSCKDDAKNKVTPGEAEQAAVAGDEAVRYEIDTTASTIEWKGSKPTGEHIGTIDIQDGFFMANNETIKGGTVTIDMKTITVLDEDLPEDKKTMLEHHLKGTAEGKETDFFNVRKYPTAVFEITGLSEEQGEKILAGNLTIKEETKNISFPVTVTHSGDKIMLESEPFTIDRTDWGVNYGSKSVFDNLGDNWISDDMVLTLDITATKTE